MIIDLKLDYTIVDKESFKRFVRSLNPCTSIISRLTLSNRILNSTASIREKIASKLHHLDSISLTSDIWSPRKGTRGFGCVTAHHTDGNWNVVSFILDFKRIKFPHDGDTICIFSHDVVTQHKLEGKVVSLTTDNASSNISAIKKLGNSLQLGHNRYGSVHYKCMAQINDLGVRASMKELKSAIGPVRSVIMAIKSSTKRYEAFHRIQKTLMKKYQNTNHSLEQIEDVDHRWNSCWLMLERAHLQKDAID